MLGFVLNPSGLDSRKDRTETGRGGEKGEAIVLATIQVQPATHLLLNLPSRVLQRLLCFSVDFVNFN